MKLYVVNKRNLSEKVYLDIEASTRLALARIWGADFAIGGYRYSVYDVWAEPSSNSTISGAVAGGIIGALAGPAGILLGGSLGTLIGGSAQEEENRKVNTFNRSQI